MPFPLISIIIPVYNAEKYIEKCLDSILNQNIDSNIYEILVIDNNSSDNTAQIVKKYSKVIMLNESKQGSYAARNKGLDYSKGKYLAFTDADCIVDRFWLSSFVEKINEMNGEKVICGSVNYITETYSVWGVFDSLTFLNQEHNVKKNSAVTANIFVSKKIMVKVGKFDENLKSGGDVEWSKRLFKNDVELLYFSKAKVFHPIRDTFKENMEKCFRVGFGNGQLIQKMKRYYAFPKPSVSLTVIKSMNNINEKVPYKKNIHFWNKIELIIATLLLQIINYSGKVAGIVNEMTRSARGHWLKLK